MKRIFIAIPIPEKIKDDLLSFKEDFSYLPAKWVKKENIHLTLFFLGYLKNEEKIKKVMEITQKICQHQLSFFLSAQKVEFFPKNKPRLLWVRLNFSDELFSLRKKMEKEFLINSIPFEKENFLPHITLARIKQWQLRTLEEPVSLSEKQIDFSFEVSLLEVIESKLKPQGPDYFLLKSFPFSKK
mgnify:CR=1 FL=1